MRRGHSGRWAVAWATVAAPLPLDGPNLHSAYTPHPAWKEASGAVAASFGEMAWRSSSYHGRGLHVESMVTKKQRQPEVFSGRERFFYLLTELEIVITGGTVQWSAATADMARRRLEALAATIRGIADTVKKDHLPGR